MFFVTNKFCFWYLSPSTVLRDSQTKNKFNRVTHAKRLQQRYYQHTLYWNSPSLRNNRTDLLVVFKKPY